MKKWAEWREGQAAEYKGTPFAHSFAELDKKIRAALAAGNDRRADNLKRQWEHERFARGFEMYLKTGDAPTKGLRAVFAKFRAFLQRVYQAFTGTGGKATPEVEEVMARMISIEDSSDLSAYPRGKETDGFSMPKFSARTNGESRVGNFRRMMDALKSGVRPSPRVEVHDGRREVTADIGARCILSGGGKEGDGESPGDELSAKAIAYAQEINDDANFDYSAANAPGMLRAGSVITQQLFQFQKYPIIQFEFMYNILKNGTRGQRVSMLVP